MIIGFQDISFRSWRFQILLLQSRREPSRHWRLLSWDEVGSKEYLFRHPLQTEWIRIKIIYVIKGQLFVDATSLLSLQRSILDNSASQSESAVVAKSSLRYRTAPILFTYQQGIH